MTSRPLKLHDKTVTGNHPFNLDEQNKHRCPKGHVAGLNSLSELYVERRSWDGNDWCRTEVFFGLRQGELRPEPRLLISQRLRRLLVELKAKGFALEVAHLV